ncbi:MAG: ATP-grasp protein, partial [Solirubrobacteraceae bacterium]|nr:ATP-grasp protein [Solirubrobacteraceae bacterium]
WLPGDREAISFVYGNGTFWARFAQRADRMLPAIGGSSIMREAIALPPDSTDAAQRLVAAIGLDGYCEVEFRRDAEGRPVLMEINPRLSASVEIAVRAGVPFPRLVFELAAGAPMTAAGGYRVGTRMRWLGGDVIWLAQAFVGERGNPDMPSRRAALRAFLASFLRRTGYDMVQRGDLRPARVAAMAGLRGSSARMMSLSARLRRR